MSVDEPTTVWLGELRQMMAEGVSELNDSSEDRCSFCGTDGGELGLCNCDGFGDADLICFDCAAAQL